jgi:hypothetical protein
MESCVAKLARSIANPFEESACIPDGATGVGVFTLRETATLTTGTTGTCYGIVVGANPNAFFKTDSGTSAVTPTLTGNWVGGSGNATVNTLYASYRPVSGGIKVSFTGNTINDSGVIVLAQFSGDLSPGALNGLSLSAFCSASQYFKTFPLRNGGVITWRPEEMDDQDVWQATSLTAVALSAQVNAPFMAAYIYSAQPAGVSSVQVEYVFNFEGQFKTQTFLSGGNRGRMLEMATPGWYEKSKNLVSNLTPIIPLVGAVARNLLFSATGMQDPLPRIANGPTVEEV